jgi:aminoglycoside 3-N-acetyltransferase
MPAPITQSQLQAGFAALGVPQGGKVLIHSSLRSLGQVEGGAAAVIAGLLDVLGPDGTLLVPTLTGSEELSSQNPPVFDPDRTPSWTGLIPETLRRRPDATRSLHPTHSVVAVGRDAAGLLAGHACSITPCDEWSPYGELAQQTDGYILLVGVTHASNTTFHHVEEMAGLRYHMQEGFAAAQIILHGAAQIRHVVLHRYGPARNFDVMEPLFVEQGIQRIGTIGAATVRLIHAPRMVRATLRAVAADPTLLLAKE